MPIIVLVIFVMIVICVILARFMTIGIVRPIEEATLNLEDYSSAVIYKELQPFLKTIRSQHEGILQSARMRQDFTANVSHELKTPLTAISGYSELIENRMVRGDEVVRFASEIHRNSDRLLYLINDIIRLSEMDTDKINIHFEEVDLYDIAKKCEPTLEMNAKQHEVCFHLEGEAVKITANRDMVSEIIMNLCDNSIKYNNPCGNVVLRIGIEDGNPMIEVKDDGIGISAEHQEHVFERFYRVDKSRSRQTGGTGLGLAIVKHICSLHQAEIILNSGVGIGKIGRASCRERVLRLV